MAGAALVALAACSTSKAGDDDTTSTSAAGGSTTSAAPSTDPGSTTGLTATTMKIAFLVPDFGPLAASGLVPELGDGEVQMSAYIDHVNENGGIGGRQVEATFHTFDPADGSGTSQREACIAGTEEDEAFVVIGMPSWGNIGTVCVAGQHETPILTSTAPTPNVERQTGGRSFSISMNLVRQFRAWVSILDERGELDGRTIGIVTGDFDDNTVEAARDGVEYQLEQLGYDVAELIVLPCAEAACTQHETAVARFEAAGVDYVFDVLNAVGSPTFINNALAAGYEPEYTFYDTLTNDTVAKFHESVGTAIDGMHGVGSYGPPNPGEPAETNDFLSECVAIHDAEPGVEPLENDAQGFMQQGCVMVEMLIRGAENAVAEGELGRDSLVRGIEAIGTLDLGAAAEVTCPPASRPLTFGPDKHDGGNWFTVTEFDGASTQFLRPADCEWIEIPPL